MLFLPDSGEGEPCFASLSEIYVSQELAAGGMPKDEEEADGNADIKTGKRSKTVRRCVGARSQGFLYYCMPHRLIQPTGPKLI